MASRRNVIAAFTALLVGSLAVHLSEEEDTVTEKWSFETGIRVRSSPAVLNDSVYVGSEDNNVYAIGEARTRGPPRTGE